FQNSLGHELRLFASVIERHQCRLHRFRVPRGTQILFELFDVGCYRAVRDFENFRHAAIVQLDPEYLRLWITLWKFEDILKIRAPPGVDRLRIIADHHYVLMLARQNVDEVSLDLVRVLVFVHQNELELPPVNPRDVLVLEQHSQRFFQQIVEVEGVGRLLLSLVTRLHIFDLLEQGQEVGKFLREQFLYWPLGVNYETKNVREHVGLWKPHFLGINSRACHPRRNQILLIFAIHDGETGGIAE